MHTAKLPLLRCLWRTPTEPRLRPAPLSPWAQAIGFANAANQMYPAEVYMAFFDAASSLPLLWRAKN